MDATLSRNLAVEIDGRALAEYWCLQTVSMKEFAVGRALERLGIDAYVPAYQARDQGKYFNRLRVRPLFPTYLFSRPISGEAYMQLKGLLGVRSWVHYVGAVDYDVIEGIYSGNVDSQGFIRLYDDLNEGDLVEITEGMCEGYLAPVRKILYGETSADDRVTILLSMLGRQCEVTLGRDQVRKASYWDESKLSA